MIGNVGKVGAAVFAVFVVLAVISLIFSMVNIMYQPLYGTDPEIIGFSQPSSQHLLGTDFMGRDLFSQLCAGSYTAIMQGVLSSVLGMGAVVVAALIMAHVREETPQLEETFMTRYVRFVAFPLGVAGLILVLSLLAGSALGRLSSTNMIFLAGMTGLLGLMAWLAVGHDIEVLFRKGGKIPAALILSGAALIISYTVICYSFLAFIGLGDPSVTSWGMMLQWCFTSGYTFKAPFWLLPPMICVYMLSRGMLALSYGLYNNISEKYFFVEGWL
jgi:peptide/nickel transport system permease protein